MQHVPTSDHQLHSWDEANLLRNLPGLRNIYFGLRHGYAESNNKGIFVTKIEMGSGSYGLMPRGFEQVNRSVNAALEAGMLDAESIILSSDFLRAKQTAEAAALLLTSDSPVRLEQRIRERFFGSLDLQPDSGPRLDTIRRADVANPLHNTFEVESPANLIWRMSSLIVELEASLISKTVLLVSHGDPLRILRAGFELARPGDPIWHKEVVNGELIALKLGSGKMG